MAEQQALIIDDHPTVLSGLQRVLKEMSFETTALPNADSALANLRTHSYHLILLDMQLPDMDGKTLLNIIRISDSDTPILMISGCSNTSDIMWMLKNGAQGFIDKKEPRGELIKAVRMVADGNRYMPQSIRATAEKSGKEKKISRDYSGISRQQKQIIDLVEEGYTNKEISKKLEIAEGTLAANIRDVFRILKINDNELHD